MNAVAYCKKQIAPDAATRKPVFYAGAPQTCDGCGNPIELRKYFADCFVPYFDNWCFLCDVCIAGHKIKFAWGKGQLYQQQKVKPEEKHLKWRLVAGFPENDEGDDE